MSSTQGLTIKQGIREAYRHNNDAENMAYDITDVVKLKVEAIIKLKSLSINWKYRVTIICTASQYFSLVKHMTYGDIRFLVDCYGMGKEMEPIIQRMVENHNEVVFGFSPIPIAREVLEIFAKYPNTTFLIGSGGTETVRYSDLDVFPDNIKSEEDNICITLDSNSEVNLDRMGKLFKYILLESPREMEIQDKKLKVTAIKEQFQDTYTISSRTLRTLGTEDLNNVIIKDSPCLYSVNCGSKTTLLENLPNLMIVRGRGKITTKYCYRLQVAELEKDSELETTCVLHRRLIYGVRKWESGEQPFF